MAASRGDGPEVKRSGRLTPCPSKMAESVLENFSKHPCGTGSICAFVTSSTHRGRFIAHLHHGVPRAVVSQLPQPVDEALAGLTVGPAGLHHGLALLHQLDHSVTGLERLLRSEAAETQPTQTESLHLKGCHVNSASRGTATQGLALFQENRKQKRTSGRRANASPSLIESPVRSHRSAPLRSRL